MVVVVNVLDYIYGVICGPDVTGAQFHADEAAKLEKLVEVIRVILPETNMDVAETDGVPYVHLWTPDETINYFIEPAGDAWEGKPRGRIGLPFAVSGSSAGAVALAAAGTFVSWLFGAAEAASSILGVGVTAP